MSDAATGNSVQEPQPDRGQDEDDLLHAADGLTKDENHRYEEGVV